MHDAPKVIVDRRRNKVWKSLIASLTIVLADQVTKALMLASFHAGQEYPVTPFFSLVLAFNSGAAFSFLAQASGWQRYLFIATAIGASVFVIVLLRRGGSRLYNLGLALIFGGAVGNLCDRIAIGQVIDFLLFHYKNWYYPAFNIADTAVAVGIALLIWDSFRQRRPGAPKIIQRRS